METSSSAPAFAKRNKSKTARVRTLSPTNDAASTGDEPDPLPSTLATKLKNKHKARSKPKARLSFGGDDEDGDGEVFQVKKSNLSRKLKLSAAAIALPATLDQASISPESRGPVYSKEYLSELKASTLNTPSLHPPLESHQSELYFAASEMEGAIVEGMDVDQTTFIPSESSITAAKQKRERLRTSTVAGGDDGIISLSVTRKEDVYQGPHPESRLMREDDDLGEGDDEFAEYTNAQERIALGKKAKKKEATERRHAMKDMINDAEEVDEETMEWEREQLRRGVTRAYGNGEQTPVTEVYRPAPIPPATPVPILGPAIARVTQALMELTVSHTSSTAAMTSLVDERQALDQKEKGMRVMVEEAERKRRWFMAFREWVESVATFLDEKYPLLEKLEDEHVSLLRERSAMVIKRRLQDDEDDLSFCFGSQPDSPPPAIEVLDELGRVIPPQTSIVMRRERQAARIARRTRRAATKDDDGYSTDATLPPSDASDFQLAISKLATRVNNVLEDVRSDEFKDPGLGVAKWFGEWRTKYSETYTGAYGGLGMVSAWEFWVRLEIVGWNPLEDPRTLDSFAWYSSLYEYSRPRSADAEDEEELALGPDGDLVSAMISTAVVPRLCKVIQGGAFDPYNAKHVRVLLDLAEQVEASANADKFELLLNSATVSFRDAVNATVDAVHRYRQLHGMQFDPEAIPARQRFLRRRLKLIQNLLRWRKYTGEKFGIRDLVVKVVQECMITVAEGGWEVGGHEVLRKAGDILPFDLLPPQLRSMLC